MTDAFWTWLAGVIPTGIVAGIAAYVGAYLQERGRNLATREDVDRVFRLQEEMRARVSGGLWEEQERWRFKADYYSRLLQNLAEQERLNTWFAWNRPVLSGAEGLMRDLEKRYSDRLEELWLELVRCRAVADVWLGAPALKALNQLRREQDEKWTTVASNKFFVIAAESLETAMAAVTTAAKEDLRLDLS